MEQGKGAKPKVVGSKLDYKELERVGGFLFHLSMMNEFVTPLLKDFHLMLATHLLRQDVHGWKLTTSVLGIHTSNKT
jgi:hypothetical protein